MKFNQSWGKTRIYTSGWHKVIDVPYLKVEDNKKCV